MLGSIKLEETFLDKGCPSSTHIRNVGVLEKGMKKRKFSLLWQATFLFSSACTSIHLHCKLKSLGDFVWVSDGMISDTTSLSSEY